MGKLPDLARVVAEAAGQTEPEQDPEEQLAAARDVLAAFGGA